MNTIMKKVLILMFVVTMTLCNTVLLHAAEEDLCTQAIWTKDNTTLTFYYGPQLYAGGFFNGQEITDIWSGTDVTETGTSIPEWQSEISDSVTTVIFDTSFAAVKPTSTYAWFYSCKNLRTIDFSGFDSSQVTDMGYMFCDCTYIHDLDVSSFNTSNVKSMCGMFKNCMSLVYADVSNFDTSEVTDMSYMFDGCLNLDNLDVSRFDTSDVTDMKMMFNGCTTLTNLDVSRFDTSKVENMCNMFCDCFNLTYLDLSSFDVSNLQYADQMFDMCISLETIYCSDSSTDWSSYIPNGGKLFYGCECLVGTSESTEVTYHHSEIKKTMAKSADLGGYFTPSNSIQGN